ncbi:MAG: hypothetical protein ACRDDY_03830 [Clostridium sp.]|uniref:hypothetical protein n=1 Tax=Clostridium sp. TaxID=1506 RepID=UPI003EE5EEAD
MPNLPSIPDIAKQVDLNKTDILSIQNILPTITNEKGAGWFKDKKTGLIIQWNTTSGSGRVPFQIAFSSKPHVFVDGHVTNADPIYKTKSGAYNPNETGFTIVTYGYETLGTLNTDPLTWQYITTVSASSFSGTSSWLAIGY